MSSVIGQTIGSGPAHSPARSAPLQAPTTPGISSAFETSTFATLALANGLRTTARCSMPGSVRLSTKFPCPVTSEASSLRGTDVPTNFSVIAISPPSSLRAGHLTGGVEDRLHDVVVAGAPAEVALERLADLLVGWVRVLLQVADRRHDHARRAVPALEAVVAMDRLLDRVHLPVGRQPLDRRDLPAVDLHGEQVARLDGLTVHQDGARTARRGIASDVGPGEPEGLPEEVHEERARLDVRRARDPVDGDRHVGHGSPFPRVNSDRKPEPCGSASPWRSN